MKRLLSTLVFILAILVTVPGIAQDTKQMKKDIDKKAMKQARKQAKELKKDGFKVDPGQMPMDKQIEDTWLKRAEVDENGNKMWFVANAKAVGETHTAAKLQASEVAKVNLAGQIGTEVVGLVETTIANAQLSPDEAESVTETVAAFQSKIGAKIGRTTTLFEASRGKGDVTEVFITLGYNYADAVRIAKDIIRKDLKEKANIQSDKLDELLDF